MKKRNNHRRSRLAALIAVLILLCAVSALYIVKTSTERNVEHNIDVAETVEPAADALAEDYSDAELDLHFVHEEARSRMMEYAARWETNKILSLVTGPGLYTWILIFCASRCVQYQSMKMFCIILPLLILMIGLPFTPVNGDVRYAYPILSSAPLLVALCFNPTVTGST